MNKQILNELNQKYHSKMFDSFSRKEKTRILKRAEQILRKEIIYDFPWDMEVCHIPYQMNELKFHTIANEDEEWCFMLNRFAYLSYLVQAYILSKDEKYVEGWLHYVNTWIQEHQEMNPSLSTRTLDTAIRCLHWVEDMLYLIACKAIPKKDIYKIKESILQQLQYLQDKYESKYDLSNWGSIQSCAIVCCLCRLDKNYQQNALFNWALDKMQKQFLLQINEDGLQWEQSTMYHAEVLHYGLKVLLVKKYYEFPIQGEIKETITKMAYALMHLTTPKGCIDNFGDSDYTNTQDMLSYASCILLDGGLKKLSFETLPMQQVYEVGHVANITWKNIQPSYKHLPIYDAKQSGLLRLCFHENEDSDYLQCSNGQYGSGHTHSHPLHFSLYRKGNPFLIDSGRYTYKEESIRTYLKSMEAHNCLIVSEKPTSLPKGSWDCIKHTIPLKNTMTSKEGCHYIEMGLISKDATNSYTQLRKILIVEKGIYLIVDQVYTSGKKEVATYYHIDPSYLIKADKSAYSLVHPHDKVKMYFFPNQKIQVKTVPHSPTYNKLDQHQRMKHIYSIENEGIGGCALYDEAIVEKIESVTLHQEGKQTMSYIAQKFICKNKETYVFILFHEEVFTGKKVCYYKDIALYGKSIIILEKEGDLQIHYLKK